MLEKCQNYRFFDIFLDILDKMKENLGQERVKREFYPSRARLEDFSDKRTGFSGFDPFFPPISP